MGRLQVHGCVSGSCPLSPSDDPVCPSVSPSVLTLEMVSGMLKSFPPCSLKPHGAGPFRVTVYELVFASMWGNGGNKNSTANKVGRFLLLPGPGLVRSGPIWSGLVRSSPRWLHLFPPRLVGFFSSVNLRASAARLLPALRTNTLGWWWWVEVEVEEVEVGGSGSSVEPLGHKHTQTHRRTDGQMHSRRKSARSQKWKHNLQNAKKEQRSSVFYFFLGRKKF